MSNQAPVQEGKREVHVGFKFSLGEIMHTKDLGQITSYHAHPERTFEAAYNWTDKAHNIHNGWTDNLYDSLGLPEVNVVVSGYFTHPVVTSKLGETCTPRGTIRESEMLAYMSPQKTTVVIQGDALHNAKQFTFINGSTSPMSALQTIKNEISARTNNLSELVQCQQHYAKMNMPPVAIQECYRIFLQECDAKGMTPFQDYDSTIGEDFTRFIQQYVQEYIATQSSSVPLTQDQLIYGNMVKAAGELTTSASIENRQIFGAMMERAIEKLEDANRDAHYAQLTPSAVLAETIKRLPAETREIFSGIWDAVQADIDANYPEKSQQWKALETQYEALTHAREFIPQDILQNLLSENSAEFSFINERESVEYEAITPLD